MTTKKTLTDSLWIRFFPIALLGFLAYWPSLHGQFVWDDLVYIVKNPYVKDWSRVFAIFFKNIASSSSGCSDFYRPLQEFTNLLDYSIWKENAFGYHLTNILLHLLVGLGVFRMTRLLFQDRLLSFLASLLFVLYPGHTGAVSYISGRCDLLSALFMLIAFENYLKALHESRKISYVLAWLSYGLALLSKENAVIFPFLLVVYHIAFRKKSDRALFSPLLILAIVYGLLKVTAPHFEAAPLERIPGFFAAMAGYARLLAFPTGLHMDHGNPTFTMTDAPVLAGAGFLLLLILMAWKTQKTNTLAFFSIGWFLISLAPTNGVYPLTLFYMAEHWLYFPSIGFFLILAAGLLWLFRQKAFKIPGIVLTATFILFYLYGTIAQSRYWRDPVSLYQRTLQFTPQSYMAHLNLGAEYFKANDLKKAQQEYYAAVQINPGYAPAHHNMCQVFLAMGMYPDAVGACQRAVELAPRLASAYGLLGNAYEKLRETEKAVPAYQKAIELDPVYASAYNDLAKIYAIQGKNDLAETFWKKTLQLDPGRLEANYNLCIFYFSQKQYDPAVTYCRKAREKGAPLEPSLLKFLEDLQGSKMS